MESKPVFAQLATTSVLYGWPGKPQALKSDWAQASQTGWNLKCLEEENEKPV